MPEKFTMKNALLMMLCCILFSACSPAPDTANLLVWRGTGETPAGGEIGFITGDEQFKKVMDVPAQARQVKACGDAATSPDGRLFAFYVGQDSGQLHLMSGMNNPLEIGSASALSCLGGGTFRYSPDNRRLAYIDTGRAATNGEFITGTLRVAAVSDGNELLRHENIAAFDLDNNSAAFVRFFTSNNNLVDEAVIWGWDGGQEREIATLRPDQGCRYTSASIGLAPQNSALLILGQRCSALRETHWQLYRVDLNTGGASLVESGMQPGGFVPYARTNMLIFAPDRQTAYFSVPDGVVAHTASLRRITLADMTTQEVIARQVIMPTLTGTANSFPLVSPDQRWLALVVTTPNNENTLTVIDLANPQAEPITTSAGGRGDVILSMSFTRDSQRLYYVAGGSGSSRNVDNALMRLDLPGGTVSRLKRGRYAPGLALAPGGQALGTLEYQLPPNDTQQPYLNLVRVSTSGGETAATFQGATLTEGRVTERFAVYPLSWRP